MKEFRDTARRLLFLDGNITSLSSRLAQIQKNHSSDLLAIIFWAAVTLAGWAIYQFFHYWVIILVGGFLLTAGLLRTILAVQTMVLNSGIDDTLRKGTAQLKTLKNTRSQMVQKLNAKRAADPRLHRRFWWDAEIDPTDLIRQVSGLDTADNLILLFPMKLTAAGSDIHLNDMTSLENTDQIAGEAVRDLLRRIDPASEGLVYYNRHYLTDDYPVYLTAVIYESWVEPITEIISSEQTRSADVHGMMKEYRSQLDRIEKEYNYQNYGSYETNRSMYFNGDLSEILMYSRSIDREEAENDFENSIRGMTETRTVYSEEYRNLNHITMTPCATVYLAVQGDGALATAAVLLHRKDRETIRLTLRGNDSTPYIGDLTEFDDYRALDISAGSACSTKALIDYLYDPKTRETLGIPPMDPLSAKPAGLTDAEWCYLLRRGCSAPRSKAAY